MKEIIVLLLFFILIIGVFGGIVWIFVREDLETTAYLKFLSEFDKLDEEEKENETLD